MLSKKELSKMGRRCGKSHTTFDSFSEPVSEGTSFDLSEVAPGVTSFDISEGFEVKEDLETESVRITRARVSIIQLSHIVFSVEPTSILDAVCMYPAENLFTKIVDSLDDFEAIQEEWNRIDPSQMIPCKLYLKGRQTQ